MLRLEEIKFSGTSIGTGSFSNNLLGRPYSRYSQSGLYVITLKEYPEFLKEHYLEIYNSISGFSYIKTFRNGVKFVRNVSLVHHKTPQENENCNREINFGDLIFIEDKKGGVEIYCLNNRRSLLFSCMILVGKCIKSTCAIKINKSILIVAVMTDSEVFLFSNFLYNSFEDIYRISEFHNSTENHMNDDFTDCVLRYYKRIAPDFNANLGACCITSLGRFYFSCSNEIFKLEFPSGEREQSSDFQLEQVYMLDLDGKKSETPPKFSINYLMSHETFVDVDKFELIYIIHDDEKHIGLKKLSLLRVRIDSSFYEYNFDKLSTIGSVGKCCNILSCKVFENGQFGVIWKSDDQIYVNIFNHFLNGFQKSSLNYSSCLTSDICAKKPANRANYRDLASLLYGDAPLIYINESEFSSSNQRTNEILKIHSRVFSESLKVRDIEKEEQIIKNVVDSTFLNENTLIRHGDSYSKTGFNYKQEEPVSDNFPLRNMDQFVFFGLPLFFSPVLGIQPNKNITNFPDDWYSCMSFAIHTFTCNSNGDQNIVRVIYTCWYEGIFNYLNNNLHSILKTPQMHLHVLKKLTLLLPESKFSKPTSLWIALNSIKTFQEFQSLDKSDVNLFFNIIDVYIKNGMERQLIDFTKNNSPNFSNVLYSWSIHQSIEVLSFLKKMIKKNKSDLYKKIFRFKEYDEFLGILLGLPFLNNGSNLLTAFVSSNIIPLKSALKILEFALFTERNPNTERNESLFAFGCLVYSLLEWNSIFGLIGNFKSYVESCNSQTEHCSFQFPTSGLISLAIENINEQSILERVISEEILIDSNFTWESLLTLSLLLESFNACKVSKNAISGLCSNQLNLVSKLDKFFSGLLPVQNSCHIFSRIVSNSIIIQDFIDFY
ncbi:uncharacterized protein cubi_03487 [Cryptosporidium ubiquitum]|uniref:Uncharacterized protein n=1 Tax=Cryptosporidium ubiquitum TaxID=857276 RepID=A0A1J4MHG9_9CRYT|nr:uncharacterized protein cubi_03487 [Cryptosporidium ubiquitum]OII73689.1 hypothetical protein cubi_03487 [Cryptosporidium ubiquitum]